MMMIRYSIPRGTIPHHHPLFGEAWRKIKIQTFPIPSFYIIILYIPAAVQTRSWEPTQSSSLSLLLMIQSLTSIFNYQPPNESPGFSLRCAPLYRHKRRQKREKEDAAGSKMQWMDEIYIINRQTSNNVYTRSSSSSSSSSDTDPNG